MKDRINRELERIARIHGVTVLFACESGSRAWGFPSKDSDYDVRFVYVHPCDWYLRLEKRRDVIEEPISNDLDVSGWDLDKALRLLRNSNPNILEWVESPILYFEHPQFQVFRSLLKASFNPRASVLHYLNMARNNMRQYLNKEEIKIKKYLYTIRPLLCAEWVRKYLRQPPMLYFELLDHLHPDSPLNSEVRELVRKKVDMKELDLVSKNSILTDWIEATTRTVSQSIPEASVPPGWDVYNAAFLSMARAATPK